MAGNMPIRDYKKSPLSPVAEMVGARTAATETASWRTGFGDARNDEDLHAGPWYAKSVMVSRKILIGVWFFGVFWGLVISAIVWRFEVIKIRQESTNEAVKYFQGVGPSPEPTNDSGVMERLKTGR